MLQVLFLLAVDSGLLTVDYLFNGDFDIVREWTGDTAEYIACGQFFFAQASILIHFHLPAVDFTTACSTKPALAAIGHIQTCR